LPVSFPVQIIYRIVLYRSSENFNSKNAHYTSAIIFPAWKWKPLFYFDISVSTDLFCFPAT